MVFIDMKDPTHENAQLDLYWGPYTKRVYMCSHETLKSCKQTYVKVYVMHGLPFWMNHLPLFISRGTKQTKSIVVDH